MNLDKINNLIEEKYVSVQKRPIEDLYIYNYTHKAQFEGKWDKEIRICRGLILDGNSDIIARPMEKFFNYEEVEVRDIEIPKTDFKVYEKLDGSLIILFYYKHKWRVATRGSFTSDQAIKARELLINYQQYINKFNRNYTYSLEVIYKSNRIVCDYGEDERLVLLAGINIETGKEIDIMNIDYPDKPEILSGVKDYKEIKAKEEKNKEGFVIRYENGFRLKVKFENYKRLHSMLTGMTARKIWQALKDKEEVSKYLEKVPDEFYKFFKDKVKEIGNNYKEIESKSIEYYKENRGLDRKELAIKVNKEKDKRIIPIVFSLLDKKDYSETIWKMIKPKHEMPLNQIEDNE